MSDHYWAELPVSAEKLHKIETVIRNKPYSFFTSSGVFSSKRIDRGTLLLAEYMDIPSGKILDLGCGIGVLGIVAAAEAPETHVILTDVNQRATWLARKNTKLNDVEKNTEVRTGHLYQPVQREKFNSIISNPPISAGLSFIKELIIGAREGLIEGGKLQLVVRKGATTVKKMMKETFNNAENMGKKAGYQVIYSSKENTQKG